MRQALIAFVLALAVPSAAEAKSKVSFFFGFGSSGGYYRPYSYYCPPVKYSYTPYYYRPYSYGHYPGYYRVPYSGAYHGRYAVPRVYSPYRYGDYRRDYAYRRDQDYRRGLYYDRGYYYGPAVQRYHRDARDYPSYHYDRRENYIRGSDPRSRDRGDRYR